MKKNISLSIACISLCIAIACSFPIINEFIIIPRNEEQAYEDLRNNLISSEVVSSVPPNTSLTSTNNSAPPPTSQTTISPHTSLSSTSSSYSSSIIPSTEFQNNSTHNQKPIVPEIKHPIKYSENELKEKNPDIVGWINIPNSVIDYPIMQSSDNNEYYLYHNYKNEETLYGSIVLDFRNDSNSENLIMYGHNMLAGNMFAYLRRYEQYYTYKNNNTIYLMIFGEKKAYEVFSVIRVTTEGDNYFNYARPDFDNPEEYKNFLNRITSLNMHGEKFDIKETDNIISLSTCVDAYSNWRTVVFAKEIKTID